MIRLNSSVSILRKTKDTSSSSLKHNLEEGRKLLNEFKTEFPYLKSTSMFDVRRNNIEDSAYHFKHLFSNGMKSFKDNFLINWNRFKQRRSKCNTYESYQNRLKKIIKKHPYANCHECSDLLRYNALKDGFEPQSVIVEAMNKKKGQIVINKDHVFTVIGMDKNAYGDMPSTWGNKAVVVDGWSGLVLPAKEALRHYEHLFKIDPKTEKTIFSIDDYFV